MKIRRIEIQGFKSFADRTVFEFDDGIAAVVGPNGCGKSNVVDAIKWVLGDMSPRSLRGKRMEDVIFAGSRGRKPLGLAEVTLVLDNEDGLLPTEHTEVAVTRRLHRSGESGYLLNRQVCRLKDIRELFMDTGLGQEGNSIMEQGQIDALLAANPADRRGIFEEAAGVSRYKQRRKEADLRLKRTQENLERLRDVLDLEEKRLRSLKNQAGRARRYQELREELARKRVLRAVVRYRAVSAERGDLQQRMGVALEKEGEAAGELAALEEGARQAERDREQAREAVHEVERRIAQAASDVRAARDRADFAARSIEELRGRIETARRSAGESREQAHALEGEIASLEAEAEAAAEEARGCEGRVAEAEADLERIEGEARRVRDALDATKRQALNALGRLGDVRNEEAEGRVEIRQTEQRLERLEQQHAEVNVQGARLEGEARELAALTARLEETGRSHAAALDRGEEHKAEQIARAEAAGRSVSALAEQRADKAARLEVLRRLAAAREGVDTGARRVMEALEGVEPDEHGARDGVLGLLADLVDPSTTDAGRLDRLLGHAAGALVVRTTRDAMNWIDWLRTEGGGERARFLCLDLIRGDDPAGATVPLGELGCDERVARLVRSAVAGTVMVPDLRAGIQEFRERGYNAVTPSGDRVTASGALLGGRDASSLGLVERSTEIRHLAEDLLRLASEVEQARREVREAEDGVRDAEEEVRRVRAALAQQAADHSRRGEALIRVEKERRRVADLGESLASEERELRGLLDEARAVAESVGRQVAELEQEREALEQKADEAARGYLALDGQRKRASEHRMNLRLALAEAGALAEAARGRIERAQAGIGELEARASALDEEAVELEGRSQTAEVEVTEAQALERSGEAEREHAGDELVRVRKRLAELEQSSGAAEQRRLEVRGLHERLREELEAFRMRDSEFRARLESLVEQVKQDHGLDLAQEASAPEESEEGAEAEAIDFEAVDEEVTRLRGRLESLGNVNLNAIEELREVQEHVEFLNGQEKDLIEASAGLESAIQHLDQISTERFAATFEEIRTNFRTTFRRLFGGGRADVMLEDASDLLESGIEIIARPPGKEQRTISLLSGGERTLTAVALLFAVFQAKPSPFAILDEVDAALDEANVRRLIHMVREFTDRCQFVIITHAKATMEAADLLYGVTMDEPGVSRKVAVRLTGYPEEAEAVAAG